MPASVAGDVPASSRTTDELVQLYGVSAGFGALTAWSVHTWSDGSTVATTAAGAFTTLALAGAVAFIDAGDPWELGQPQAIVSDASVGASISALWVWHDAAKHGKGDRWSPKLQSGLVLGGAALGATIGAVRYELRPTPPGRAAFTSSVAQWSGLLSGLIAGAVTPDVSKRDDAASLGGAVGMEGGVVLGSWLGRYLQPSLGWVRALDAGAFVGGAAAASLFVLSSDSPWTSQGTLGVAASGVALGLTAALFVAPQIGLPRSVTFEVVPEAPVLDEQSSRDDAIHSPGPARTRGAALRVAGTF